jgi:hypothetical protein
MTLQDRAVAYNSSEFGRKYPSSRLTIVREKGGDVLYGMWMIGQDYRNKTPYYGSYPPGFLDRVLALFPDVPPIDEQRGKLTTLHAFSGSLPEGPYVRCDLYQPAEIQDSVYNLNTGRDGSYSLVLADPPYTADDAAKYGVEMVNRGKATRVIAGVTEVGGHLVWLDTVWPMFTKQLWRTVGRIALVRSTNHRVRLISIFERLSRQTEG